WLCLCIFRCFFFQAEDGIRDRNVTGVQTCALPIYHFICSTWRKFNTGGFLALTRGDKPKLLAYLSICSPGCSRPGGTIWGKMQRSEERRVGKEGRSGGGTAAERNRGGRGRGGTVGR